MKNVNKCNLVLKNHSEYERSIEIMNRRGLPLHVDPPKNWDSLGCLEVLEDEQLNKNSNILDAGGEHYSSFLPLLSTLGFTHLTCINLIFEKDERKGSILYQKGDITKTDFPADHFAFIACLSVIEHGVSVEGYFREMSRILKKGALLFTSTDYWHESVETTNKAAYGMPIKIFKKEDVLELIQIANLYHLELVGSLDLECEERAVKWKEFDLEYTFIYFLLRKK